jgi:hypothetical protein
MQFLEKMKIIYADNCSPQKFNIFSPFVFETRAHLD